MTVTVVGSYLSPYVRKVLACLELKGVAYQVDPISPFFGDEAFSALSPLRRIPVLIDGELVVNDSTVICDYIEERFDGPRHLPAGPAARAQARFLEEYADSRLGDVFIWKLFAEVAVKPAIFGQKGDRALTARVLAEEVPPVMDWLESQAPAEGFRFGEAGLADFAVAAFFRNLAVVRMSPDPARWPRTLAWVERALASPPMAALKPWEDLCLTVPIREQRDALLAAGAPISPRSYAAETPRPGLMSL